MIKRKHKIILGILAFAFILFLITPVPLPEKPYSAVLYADNNELLGAKIASDEQWRFPELDSIPYKFEQSLLLFEDQHFYQHPGVNPVSIGRAFIQNIKAGRIVSGGSTLTMQLIRISKDNPPRTIWQKIKEIFLALKADLILSKKEILIKYASHAPFGGNVVGLEAACWRYYGRKPYQLSWAEAATMAILPNSPALIRPGKNMNKLKTKRNRLLQRLLKKGIINKTELELAVMERLPQEPYPLPRVAPHLLQRLAKEHRGRIHSTIDYQLQKHCNRIISRHHKKLSLNEIHNLAALIVEVETGKVLAYTGNASGTFDNNHGYAVDIITAPRSSGSILKPLLYAAMLDEGEILPESLVPDIPTQMQGYSPKNYNLDYDGTVPASRALARSLNVPAIHMLKEFGVGRFLDYLKKMQFSNIQSSADYYGLSLILGGAETSLWNLAGTYSSLARILNHYNENYATYCTKDFHKPVLLKKDSLIITENDFSKEKNILGAGAIWLTFKALEKVNRPQNELGWETFSSSHKIAWKTGTSFGFRDAWAVGVNKKYLIGVWVGNADGEGRPGLTGVTAAAPVMFDLFDLLPQSKWFEKPFEDLVEVPVCKESGMRSSHICPHTDTVDIPLAGLKMENCPYHVLLHLDQNKQFRVSSDCYPPHEMIHKAWFILPPAWEWYYKRKNPLYRPIPPFKQGCNEKNNIAMMQFVFPADASNIYIPRDLDGKVQQVVFEIAHRTPSQKVFWHLDNKYLGETREIHQIQFFASHGEHIITAVDEDGNSISKKANFINK